MVTSIATELINKGKYSRAYLGVAISDISAEMSSFYNDNFGALITSIEDNSPASKAGLKRGDLIISVNGKKIESASELKNNIGSHSPLRVVNVKFLRDKKIDIVNVTLDSLDKKSVSGELTYQGLKVVPLSSSYKQELGANINGVLVIEIEENSKSQTLNIKKGDIILQIENSEISTLDDFKRAIASQEKKRFFIYRRGSIFAVVL
ncbi:PDZ domain-containing protein [Candidatus Sulfurimonas baltica]|uniref:PDZ domain-containing protein n=1 Tax=Candidatus Sulfurimonas baltica TaxID=2740404 RepID=UPI001E57AD93|nr:PDZ domain-containing protein [Candidatus Sulfurimonas baltica]